MSNPLVALLARLPALAARSSQLETLMPTHSDDTRTLDSARQSLVVRVHDNDFQCEVLEKLARLEAKMDMLVGGGQPGRMSVAEEKIEKLERNDIRRSVYDRLVNVVITTVVSALIAFHDKWWK